MLAKNWFRILTFVLFFLLPLVGLVFAITLKSGIFMATMAVILLIALRSFVIPDMQSLWAQYKSK